MSIRETKDGSTITIYVKPNAPKFTVQLDGDEIVVHSTEEPVKGKVNKEILKELSKLLHAEVTLASGSTSRQKTFFCAGSNQESNPAAVELTVVPLNTAYYEIRNITFKVKKALKPLERVVVQEGEGFPPSPYPKKSVLVIDNVKIACLT